jgi:hypothetical protein
MTTEEREVAADQALEDGMAAVERMDASLSRKPSRGQVWKIGFVISCFVLALAMVLSSATARSVVDLKAAQVASDESRAKAEEATRKAIESLQEANRELQQRGQRTIDQPDDLDSSETFIAAATARVLANLPPAPTPTDDQVGRVLAAYFAVNPVTVSPARIAAEVEAYFESNPVEPERGEKGDTGDPGEPGRPGVDGKDGQPGHTPTADEIMAVFNDAAARNPNILCAGKGVFTEVVGIVRVPPENLPSERSFWTCLPG